MKLKIMESQMKKLLAYLCQSIFALSTVALLASYGLTNPVYADNCNGAKTQSAMADCFADNDKLADRQLNALYQNLTHKLSAGDAKRLRDSQRAWIAFRDKECTFRVAPYADGSIAATLTASCIVSLTSQRIVDFQTQLNCQEGDMACVPHVRPVSKKTGLFTTPHGDMEKGACRAAVGEHEANVLVDRCLEISSSSHPPCNIENSCNIMVDEIKRGCSESGADSPAYCAFYR